MTTPTSNETNRRRLPSLVLCELGDPGIPGLESHSPFCLKAHRALRVAGLPYDRAHASRPSDHKAHNPAAQVPVLLVDGEAVYDSSRILARIDTIEGARVKLNASPSRSVRAEARLWERFADTTLNAFVAAARWGDPRNWSAVRETFFGNAPWLVRAFVAPRIRAKVKAGLVARDVYRHGDAACWARFGELLDELDARAPNDEAMDDAGSTFWVSDDISIADIAIFAQLHALQTDLTPWQREQIAARRRLAAYVDRVDRATSVRVRALRAAVSIPPELALSVSEGVRLGLAAE